MAAAAARFVIAARNPPSVPQCSYKGLRGVCPRTRKRHHVSAMNPKKVAAQQAIRLVQPRTRLGLGAGSTIAYLVELLSEAIDGGLDVEIFTSSDQTGALLSSKEIPVQATASTAGIDLYFDGCDQLDHRLNALKSGGGIHTSEKLLAAMADQFVLIGDTSKYVPQLDARFPVVIEALPDALGFVTHQVQERYHDASITLRRDARNQPIRTKYGNVLVDLRFQRLPELADINPSLESIVGVVETSLFYQMAHKAILAETEAEPEGTGGVRIIERPPETH